MGELHISSDFWLREWPQHPPWRRCDRAEDDDARQPAISQPRRLLARIGGWRVAARRKRVIGRRAVAIDPLQVGAHLGGILIAQVAVFLQRLVDHLFQPGRQIGIQPHRSNRKPVHDAIEDHGRGVAAEGQLSGRHLVKHDAERKQIGACVKGLRPDLLRRHIGDRAERASGLVRWVGSASETVTVIVFRRMTELLAAEILASPKVEDFRHAAFGNEDVSRLDVAMHDASGMGSGQSVGHIGPDRQQPLQLQRALPRSVPLSVCPSRNSIAMKARPPSSPMS